MTLTSRQLEADDLPVAMFFAGNEHLCLVTNSSKMIVWDVTRGVESCVVSADSGQEFLHAASDEEHVFLLVQATSGLKCQVHLYEPKGKLHRKVKIGKGALTIAARDDKIYVRTKDSVKIVSSQNGNRLAKFDNLSEHTSLGVTDNYAVTISKGQLALMNLDNETCKLIQLPSSDDESPNLQLIVRDGNDDELLLLHDMTLYAINNNNRLDVTCTLSPSTDISDWSVSLGESKAISVVTRDRSDFQISHRTVTDITTATLWELSWMTDEDKNPLPSKRSANQANILGPAHMGGEARGASEGHAKKAKYDEMEVDDEDEYDEDSPTIADRLEQLQKALNEESDDEDNDEDETKKGADGNEASFVAKKATTESLTQLLRQALLSGDEQMLELAIHVHDKKVVEETCSQLSRDEAGLLLTALTTRLALKPGRADHLCSWLSMLLQTGKVKNINHLQPLQNLLQERVEVFPLLLKLDGRLSMMGSLGSS
jgi:hypothetical protein